MTVLELARRSQGLTLQALADRTGVPKSIVGDIERGRVVARPDELEKIARALNAPSPSLLLKHVSDPFNHELRVE